MHHASLLTRLPRAALAIAAVACATAGHAQTDASRVCANNWRNVMEALPSPGPLAGSATVAFTATGDRRIENARVLKSSGPAYAQAALAAVKSLRCDPGEDAVQLEVLILFKPAG